MTERDLAAPIDPRGVDRWWFLEVAAVIAAGERPELYREDEPCPEGECRHSFDDWPADTVTRRDREIDQCDRCGWTEVEVEQRSQRSRSVVHRDVKP